MISNHIGELISASRLYKTAAWGNTYQEAFINKAVICNTSLSAHEVLEQIGIIESKMGRDRQVRWGPRIIDVDIIFHNDEIIKNHHLEIPHPQLTNRNFVLIPLLDICPQKIHPVLQKSIQILAEECKDQGIVEQI